MSPAFFRLPVVSNKDFREELGDLLPQGFGQRDPGRAPRVKAEVKPARPSSEQAPPEQPDTRPAAAGPAPVNGEQREVIRLLQRIVELLDDIDGGLANIEGKLDQIRGRMP